MPSWLKQSTSVDVGIGPFLDETDGKTAETGLTITQADIRLKKNGGAWAQKNAAQTLSHEENGWYELTLDSTDTGTLGLLIVAIHESGALPVWKEYMVVPAMIYDSIVAGSDRLDTNVTHVADTAQTAGDIIGDTNDIQTRLPAALVSGRIDASVGAIAANAITAASMAADASAEIADAVWDEDATGHQTQGTFGQAIGDPGADTNTIFKAVVTDASGATVGADTTAILEDTGTTLQAELDGIQADTNDIQTRLPAALVSGRMDASVGAMAANVITAAATAADFTTEVTSGLSTLDAAGVRTAVGLASANLDTQIGTLATAAALDTVDNFLDTEIAAIKAKTDNLPAAPAATGDIPSAASIADAVWEEAIADHSGTVGSTAEQLAAAGAAGDPWATALPGSYGAGTAGKIVGDNLNATVSSRASQASLDTVDDFLDTEIAAIKAKTDNLPASPAAVGDAMTLTGAYDFAKGTAAVTESYAANGAAPTPVQALMAIHQMLMQFAISGTSYTVKKLDNSTTAFVVTLDDATNPASAFRA